MGHNKLALIKWKHNVFRNLKTQTGPSSAVETAQTSIHNWGIHNSTDLFCYLLLLSQSSLSWQCKMDKGYPWMYWKTTNNAVQSHYLVGWHFQHKQAISCHRVSNILCRAGEQDKYTIKTMKQYTKQNVICTLQPGLYGDNCLATKKHPQRSLSSQSLSQYQQLNQNKLCGRPPQYARLATAGRPLTGSVLDLGPMYTTDRRQTRITA